MKNIILVILAIFIATYGYSQVSEITNSAQITANSVIYALPRTVIKIKVEIEKEIFVAGPYGQYSQKLLNIKADARNSESYKIKSVEMTTSQEADPGAMYAINLGSMKNARTNVFALTSTGLILPTDYMSSTIKPNTISKANLPDINFYDNGANSNFKTEKTTYYNTIRTDTGIVQIPTTREQKVEKSLEAKAEEAADLIYLIRHKRIDIITGDSDINNGFDAVIKESHRLEKEYLSLFIGKKIATTKIAYVDVIPNAQQSRQSYIAFRFSETQGIVPSTDISGRPVMLELEKEEQNTNSVVQREESSKQMYLSYRVPCFVNAKLISGQNVLTQERLPVYQLGNILTIPADLQTK